MITFDFLPGADLATPLTSIMTEYGRGGKISLIFELYMIDLGA